MQRATISRNCLGTSLSVVMYKGIGHDADGTKDFLIQMLSHGYIRNT
jgi:hypothetical protein